ncbi:uncharacterized protein BXZ73DRAFT_99470 [Epithele typhae]|uniref:uncharacterized protein n=1 Tax=Epithele typhae TaxID=378194 RepID=UPI00200883E4|nr:uncharacterized protein BXZ73DRAFT_99470 [Epithele typhae]KAH9939267.1 hypothetical protein BXZ73DRAFT_99470 [Epithele typhae]
MSSSTLPSGVPALDSTLGALLIGSFLSLILFGVALYEGYTYFKNRHYETATITTLVSVVLVFDTVHVVLIMISAYHYTVTNFANPASLNTAYWSLNVVPLVGAVLSLLSQGFFARRVSLISPLYVVFAVIAAMGVVTASVCTFIITVKGFSSGTLDLVVGNHLYSEIALGSVTLTAVCLTGSLLSVLVRARSYQTRVPNTSDWPEHSLRKLWVVWVVNTGTLIFCACTTALVLAVASPHSLWWVMFYFISVRLDVITLLSVLNSRRIVPVNADVLEAGGGYGRSVLARANRLATVERWNIPELPEESPPAVIDIKVTHEVEGRESAAIEIPRRGTRKFRR